MKINKVSMAIIAATAVLAVSPAVLAQTDTNKPAAGAQAGRGAGRGGVTVESIDKAVTLTEAEKPKVKTAVEEYTKAVTDARAGDQSEMRTKMQAARTDLDKKMKEILTPEQYTKFQAMPRGGRNRQGGGGAGGAGGGAQN
jgi:Spy/CpxP family protein refolding chaperone